MRTHAPPEKNETAPVSNRNGLGTNERLQNKWHNAGILPSLKLGRSVRYRLEDIERIEKEAEVSR
jgi:hypothetical protein